MARSVHQILGLLGTKDPAAVLVYPLPPAADVAAEAARDRAAAWASVWGADFGRLTASVTAAEKDALVAAGAREQPSRG
jgi:deoxyribose-phosphate aldolase